MEAVSQKQDWGVAAEEVPVLGASQESLLSKPWYQGHWAHQEEAASPIRTAQSAIRAVEVARGEEDPGEAPEDQGGKEAH